MIRQLRYSAIGVLLAMSSCASEANEANFEAKLNKLMKANNGVTETSCQGEGNWEEVSKNNFLLRCKTDIPSQGSQVTSPPTTQERTSCDFFGDGTVWVDDGGTYSVYAPYTTYKCNNGKLSKISGSQSGGSQSGGSQSGKSQSGGSTNTKTVVSQYCDLRTTGLTSDWKGTQYSWTIYNQWSDGSKSVASSGFGYAGTVPYGC